MKKRLPLLVLLTLLIAGVTGACGSSDDPALEGAGDTTSSTGAAEEHNDADVAFAQGMIPHHAQAIEMADMALERGESADVKRLAGEIKAAQGPEIEKMRGWLKAWGEPEKPEADHSSMGDDGKDSTMMSESEMGELEAASGAELDRKFLEMMIRHHRGAIAMAETEVADGKFADALALAREIIETQQAEITTMEKLLSSTK